LEFGIILLAAGASSRMGGEHKLLLPWGAGSVVGAALKSARLAPAHHLVAVVGCRVTQTNTASAEESASTAEELSSQANQLGMMISRFNLRGISNKTNVSDTNSSTTFAVKKQFNGRSSNSSNGNGQHLKPEELISLDESDFGKY
jgi:hypothetical protein